MNVPDILFDRREEAYWLPKRRQPVLFFGWKFKLYNYSNGNQILKIVHLLKTLHNPERPSADTGASTFYIRPTTDYSDLEYSMAWCIAHWWEHYLDICPCQHGVHDEAKGSAFRQHLIASLLWWHSEGFS